MDVFMGSIMSFAFPFAPVNWALCSGQTFDISQYEALYMVLGTTYGGDGVQNFGVPNLMGRMPMGQGQGPGLSLRQIGQFQGNEKTTLQTANIPAHSHATTSSIKATTTITLANPGTAQTAAPSDTNAWIGAAETSGLGSANIFANAQGASSALQQGITNTLTGNITLTPTGNGFPLDLANPALVLNFSIALLGIFPSQS